MSRHHHSIDTASLPFGILRFNTEGICDQANKKGLLFLSDDTLIGRNIKQVFPEKNLRHLHEKNKTTWKTKGRSLEITRLEQNTQHTLLLIQDNTHNEALESMRSDFIGNISHELRTPLTVFRGYLELLLEQFPEDKQRRDVILHHMKEQNERMALLVQDLLLLTRLESDSRDEDTQQYIQPASLIRAIQKDAKQLDPNMQHRITRDLDENLLLKGWVDEIHSAFSNLIFNAVRYTPKEGHIHITWKRDQDHALFEVRDNGEGIETKHLSRITQRFYRVDKARSRKTSGGTGLGLATVKHVLIRHHATLHIESVPGEGSCFQCRFSLPDVQPAHLDKAHEP
jgi:two-component system, OmpR family, phosphate regulon sensor histidine kinase PhoR